MRLLALILLNLYAACLFGQDNLSIELPEGWHSKSEIMLNKLAVRRIFNPDIDGIMRIKTMVTRGKPSRTTVRNMTNLDSSINLQWQQWGGLAGYQHDYIEQGKLYRQWWLVHRNSIIFVVYSSNVLDKSLDDVIDKMVRSLAVSSDANKMAGME